ncbi:MAG: 16S rRNA (cytosine(1402)-N(4))-methyltransferase RsmH [Pelagibacteraceae bacterium]|jgi:16S rRNA (cytosine1402-N4)-methyltransferase|nr:16S rRNA (cytosine(1402)-N(4))-methyltransferase RsmH [Pelagibacteraceae bacterium]MDP6710374.1 16S rRNA (cytosine(1402)-N(4))-methyltransferase RsmH [Pelagibacteraceae bacterium]
MKKRKFMNATMSSDKTKHYPVMLDKILSIISPQHGGIFIDCTFGGGGYSQAILKYPNTKVYAIDRDKYTQQYANLLVKKFPKRFIFFQDKFSNLSKIIKSNLSPRAIIFDLGLSSFQLSDFQRGFSFKSKGPLNMQMGINKYSAYDVVNTLDKRNLAKIIKILGEEKDGQIIANKIIKYRSDKPIKSSEEFASIVNDAKKNFNHYKKNPATKTFQAIRIFVNQELSELILGLTAATKILSDDGLLIVVSFHSLEDKIVKNFFSLYSNSAKNPSRYLPLNKNKSDLFRLFLKKPLTPDIKEVLQNNSSRSAKLRYAIRNNNVFYHPKEFQKKFENYFKIEETRL